MTEIFLTILLPIICCLSLMAGLFAFAIFGPEIHLWKQEDENN